MSKFFKDMNKFRKYIGFSAKSSLKSEVAGSYLGWIWWILEPLLFMMVYWFIYTVIFRRTGEYITLYILIGLTLWNFFSKNLTSSVRIVAANKATVAKVYIPKYALIMSIMLQNGFKMAISFLIIVAFMIYYKVQLTIYVLWLIPIFITLFLVSFGLNCIIAHFGVFVEDLRNVINVVLRVMFYMSGVFYELVSRGTGKSVIPEPFATLLSKCNPMAFLMTSTRNCLIYSSNVGYKVLAAWFVLGILLAIGGVKLIYKYENSYIKVI